PNPGRGCEWSRWGAKSSRQSWSAYSAPRATVLVVTRVGALTRASRLPTKSTRPQATRRESDLRQKGDVRNTTISSLGRFSVTDLKNHSGPRLAVHDVAADASRIEKYF